MAKSRLSTLISIAVAVVALALLWLGCPPPAKEPTEDDSLLKETRGYALFAARGDSTAEIELHPSGDPEKPVCGRRIWVQRRVRICYEGDCPTEVTWRVLYTNPHWKNDDIIEITEKPGEESCFPQAPGKITGPPFTERSGRTAGVCRPTKSGYWSEWSYRVDLKNPECQTKKNPEGLVWSVDPVVIIER